MTPTFFKSALTTALLGAGLLIAAVLPSPALAATSHAAALSAPASAPSLSAPSAAADQDADEDDAENWKDDDDSADRHARHRHLHRDDNDLVSVGHDVTLPAGSTVDSVVAVFGSATNEGTTRQDVVSVFGDTTINGVTGGSAVAVLGTVSVNSDVTEDVVSVLGSIRLGPNARVHGDVVSVLGTVVLDPGATADHGIKHVLSEDFASAAALRQWLGHGVLWGRPLIFGTGLSWLWAITLGFLAVYVILAVLFRDAAEHCIATLHESPGKSFVTAILATLLTPLMLFLLAITVVGILIIPIALVTLFCAALFGKTTALGWLGQRCMGVRPGIAMPHPALTVLLGGIIVTLAYLVPILGIVVFIVLGMLGYGAVLYALLNRIRRAHQPSAPAGGASGPTPGPGTTSGFSAAADQASAAHVAPESASMAGSAGAATGTPGTAPAAGAVPVSTHPRAGFWIRIGALFLDAVIICALVRILVMWPGNHSERLCLLALATYGALMWKFKGATIGDIVFDLRVVRMDSRPIDWPTACVRALGCILSICALGLGFIWIGIDAEKQGWHDKLAGTMVVRVPKGTPLI